MGKRKVIEDSDDEDNAGTHDYAEAPPPPQSATGLTDLSLSTIAHLESSPVSKVLQPSTEPSTGSTGLSQLCFTLIIPHHGRLCH